MTNHNTTPGTLRVRNRAKRMTLCGLSALIAFSPISVPTANAQEPSKSNVVNDIVVTARRREEDLQDTPISITALSANDLIDRGAVSLAEVGKFVPNVSMYTATGGSGGSANLSVFIRGVGQSEFLFTVDPAVGVYVDGVYYPRALGSTLDLLDVERVEVLRGPQGTLFGKNTVGGALSVTSAKPTGETRGYVEATYGSYDRIDLRASFETSLVKDVLAAKIAVSSKNRDGYGTRLDFFTGKVIDHPGDENQSAGRLALRWTPSDTVNIDLTADYSRWRQQSVPELLLSFDESASAVAQLWNIFVADPVPMSTAFIAPDPYTSFGTGPNENNLDAWGLAATVDWEIGDNLSAKSITAYRHMSATFGRDADGGPVNYLSTFNRQKQHQFSEELQLAGKSFDDRLKWVLGAFYFDEFGRDTNDVVLAPGLFGAFQSLPGPIDGSPLSAPTAPGGFGNPINVALDLDFHVFNEIRIKSYAAFGQATYEIANALNLTIGARYSYEKKDYTLEHVRIASGVPIIPLTAVSEAWGSLTPMASLDYRFSPSVLGYASVSQGFKGGGFNGRPTITDAPPVPFDPENVTAYEIGLKSDLFDRHVRLNMALYYNDYTDIQLARVNANSAGVLVLDLGNAGDAQIKGFEVELQAQPTRNLSFSGGVGYTDFKYTRLAPGVTDISLSTKQPLVPKWTANAGLAYIHRLHEVATITLRGDVSFKSKTFVEPTNLPVLSQNAFALVNARIVYENISGNWELAAFVTNLTDKAYLAGGLSAVASFGTTEGFFGRPREFGISAKKRFP